jgi:asparaginyl-tRNA synthetase
MSAESTPATIESKGAGVGTKPSKQSQKKAAKAKIKAEKKAEATKFPKETKAPKAPKEYAELKDRSDLPAPMVVQVRSVHKHVGKRVSITGWVSKMRHQGASVMFVALRDGTFDKRLGAGGKLFTTTVQCVFTSPCSQTKDAKTMVRESFAQVKGTVHKGDGGVEILVDYWQMLGASDVDIEGRFNDDSHEDVLSRERALVLRREEPMAYLKAMATLVEGIRAWWKEMKSIEVFPPQISKMQVEGGATLMKIDYFGETGYMTQSQQLYLELALRSLGDVHCIQDSFRGELSRTRRHQSEFLHAEAEMKITYEGLLVYLPKMICFLCEWMLRHEKEIVLTMNPSFKVPSLPFKQMTYVQGIAFCVEHGILFEMKDPEGKEESKFRPMVLGDDIAEASELKMLAIVGEPICLIRFPSKDKAFYTRACPEDPEYSESVDVLLPTVGEVVGAGVRKEKHADLLAACIKEGFKLEDYKWYLETRKYGGVLTGGWGMGLQRMLMYILGARHIRDVTMIPRTRDCCYP